MLLIYFSPNGHFWNGVGGDSRLHDNEVAKLLKRWTANPMCPARMGSNPILVDIFVHTWVREAKKLYQQPTKGESDKCHIQNTKKGFPTLGIEPVPPGWRPGILTTRPFTGGNGFNRLLGNDWSILDDFSAHPHEILILIKWWKKISPLARLRARFDEGNNCLLQCHDKFNSSFHNFVK